MDAAADREHADHGNGHRIDWRISAGDPYSSSSRKKKRRVDDASDVVGAETKYTAGALDAPVPRQRRPVPAGASREHAAEELPAPAAASPEPEAKGKAALSESDEEKKRLSKGKWLAKDDSRSSLVTSQAPVKKLMHDGIRSFIPHQQLRDEHRRHAAVPPSHDGRSPTLSAALQRRLEELGATRPWLVHSKTLEKSDVDKNQNRLLVSCKRGGSGTEDCPITRCFSPAELDRVHNVLVGLCVTAFDRDGAPYDLTCKFLQSNNAYRFITEWTKFVVQNGIDLAFQKHKKGKRDVVVELWAFRSRQLPFQPQLDAEGNTFKDKDGKKELVSHHLDPDGALGLLLLHHENWRRAVKSEEEEEDDDDWKQGTSLPSVARKKKGKQQSGKRGASSASPAPVALPTPPVAEQISEELLFCAALGLLKLRQSITKQWQEHVDRGGHGVSNDVSKKSSADVEGEKTDKKQKSPGTHSSNKQLGASSQTVDSLGGGNVPLGSRSSGGRKTSTEDMAQAKVMASQFVKS